MFTTPIEDVARQHLKTMYMQVINTNNSSISLEGWGWNREEFLVPTEIIVPASLNNIIEIIFTSRKTGWGAVCDCKKSELPCSLVCVVCSEITCYNTLPIEFPKPRIIS